MILKKIKNKKLTSVSKHGVFDCKIMKFNIPVSLKKKKKKKKFSVAYIVKPGQSYSQSATNKG